MGNRSWGRLVAFVVGVSLALVVAARAEAAPQGSTPAQLAPPVRGTPVIVRPFDPPAERWDAGPRGVDVAAPVGAESLATSDGVVSFAGRVAGRNVLVIDHGGVRTTYEPVTATVPRGTRVRSGQRVGRLDAGHDCGEARLTCVHVGLRRGEDYLAPVFVMSDRRIRLLPTGAAGEIERRTQQRAVAALVTAAEEPGTGSGPPPGPTGLVRPAGSVTSRFGMRRHPVLGVWKLHDGTDFGLPCGAPLRAVAAGRVTQSYFNAGYGNRLFIDHGTVNGHRLVSSYNHASSYIAKVGQQVSGGQVIGVNGSTGYSTGCHLHLMLWADGQLVDPERWL